MTAKEYYTDCACVPAFVWGVLWFDLAIWMTRQMILAHTQIHDKEWSDA